MGDRIDKNKVPLPHKEVDKGDVGSFKEKSVDQPGVGSAKAQQLSANIEQITKGSSLLNRGIEHEVDQSWTAWGNSLLDYSVQSVKGVTSDVIAMPYNAFSYNISPLLRASGYVAHKGIYTLAPIALGTFLDIVNPGGASPEEKAALSKYLQQNIDVTANNVADYYNWGADILDRNAEETTEKITSLTNASIDVGLKELGNMAPNLAFMTVMPMCVAAILANEYGDEMHVSQRNVIAYCISEYLWHITQGLNPSNIPLSKSAEISANVLEYSVYDEAMNNLLDGQGMINTIALKQIVKYILKTGYSKLT